MESPNKTKLKKKQIKKAEWEEQYELLNEEQKKAFDIAISGKSLMISGAAGTGKSFLLSALIKYWNIKTPNHVVAITASTGIAATNLSRMLGFGKYQGTTIHSWSGLGTSHSYKKLNEDIDQITKNKSAMENWFSVHTLIIEEISMISPFFFERLEEIARNFKESKKPFGGIQLIACGDWYQLEPVRKSDPPEFQEMNYCFETKAWLETIGDNVVELFRIYRQKDIDFLVLLNEMRNGKISLRSRELLLSRSIKLSQWMERKDDTIALYSKVSQVLDENICQLNKLEGKEYVYEHSWIKRNINDVEKKFLIKKMLQTFSIDKNPIRLKCGAKVILTVNLSVPLGLVNGLQGTIVDFGLLESDDSKDIEEKEFLPIVQFQNGMTMTVRRYIWYEHSPSILKEKPHWSSSLFKGLGYSQIPLKLGFASTIHSAQGMGFDKIGLDLGMSIFSAGQAYTGLSRCKTIEGLSLLDFHEKCIITNQKVVDFYNKYGSPQKRKEYYESIIKLRNQESPTKRKTQEPLATEETTPTFSDSMPVSEFLKTALSKKVKQDDLLFKTSKSDAPKVEKRPF